MFCCCLCKAVKLHNALTEDDIIFINELVQQLVSTRFEPGSHSWYIDSSYRVVSWDKKSHVDKSTVCLSPYGISKPLDWDDATFEEMHARLETVCLRLAETALKKLIRRSRDKAVIVAACIVAAEMVDEISVEFNLKCPEGREVFGLAMAISSQMSKDVLELSLF